ncbi:hypothetical protein [Microbacter margulisiae]|uniref:Uncharacterized protein n=1 Tax=Microbacter margulisiae TaxID=1350067 RepID=A0A7W5DS56_9PORP|nr:hypothetical protein [Microbacter margulisiae]MBB3187258.1 hypothetical protein [Microbacter margulisiae]
MNNVETLLQKYFDAETSLEEEALLRNYFLSNHISSSLEKYRYLFVSLSDQRNEEIPDSEFDKHVIAALSHRHRHSFAYHFMLWSSAAVVAFFIATGTIYYVQRQNNYMIVNGQRINDPEKALMMAAAKLHLVTGKFNTSLYQVEQFGRLGKHLSIVSLFQKHDTLNEDDTITFNQTTIRKNEN